MKMPTFDGTRSKFKLFARKSKAFFTVKNIVDALDETKMKAALPVSEATVLDITQDAGKNQNRAKMQNAIAMSMFVSMLQTEELMNAVDNSTSNAWPNGLAYKVWNDLMEEYDPKDTLTEMSLTTQLTSLTFKKNENPKKLLKKLAAIEVKYKHVGSTMNEILVMTQVMKLCATEY